MRLNRYVAQSGICARRKADDLIKAGQIKINDSVITDVTYQVQPDDVITHGTHVLRPQELAYVVLHKPTGFITTFAEDEVLPRVVDLVKLPNNVRVYPVGRLDVHTTGTLLLTNDGDLAQKLAHPRFNAEKIYRVNLSRPLIPESEARIRRGIHLDDGFAKPDSLRCISQGRTSWLVTLHSGRNRIVRRLFEQVGLFVKKLDRKSYAGITCQRLPIGAWRLLTEKEIEMLKSAPEPTAAPKRRPSRGPGARPQRQGSGHSHNIARPRATAERPQSGYETRSRDTRPGSRPYTPRPWQDRQKPLVLNEAYPEHRRRVEGDERAAHKPERTYTPRAEGATQGKRPAWKTARPEPAEGYERETHRPAWKTARPEPAEGYERGARRPAWRDRYTRPSRELAQNEGSRGERAAREAADEHEAAPARPYTPRPWHDRKTARPEPVEGREFTPRGDGEDRPTRPYRSRLTPGEGEQTPVPRRDYSPRPWQDRGERSDRPARNFTPRTEGEREDRPRREFTPRGDGEQPYGRPPAKRSRRRPGGNAGGGRPSRPGQGSYGSRNKRD